MKKPKYIKPFLWGIALAVALLLFSLPRQSYAQSDKNDSKKETIKKESETMNSDGSILQESTGLFWQTTDNDKKYNHEQAALYCETLSVNGSKDWRLPAIEELKSLVDTSRKDYKAYPILNGASKGYWSSTIHDGDCTEAWFVLFSHNSVYGFGRAGKFLARCVRSGK